MQRTQNWRYFGLEISSPALAGTASQGHAAGLPPFENSRSIEMTDLISCASLVGFVALLSILSAPFSSHRSTSKKLKRSEARHPPSPFPLRQTSRPLAYRGV